MDESFLKIYSEEKLKVYGYIRTVSDFRGQEREDIFADCFIILNKKYSHVKDLGQLKKILWGIVKSEIRKRKLEKIDEHFFSVYGFDSNLKQPSLYLAREWRNERMKKLNLDPGKKAEFLRKNRVRSNRWYNKLSPEKKALVIKQKNARKLIQK